MVDEQSRTIFWCPECGQCWFARELRPADPLEQDILLIGHALKSAADGREWCLGIPILRLLVDPAQARTGWLYESGGILGFHWEVRDEINRASSSGIHRRVLVVPVPDETANKDTT